MRILVVHNYYQQPGGEDQVFAAECALLEAYGHQVHRYTIHNDQIKKDANRLALVGSVVWNAQVYQELRTLIGKEQIQIIHLHNTFPLISPAAYYAAKAEGIPVIQTLHNYRLLCPNGVFFRDGRVCEACIDKVVPLPSVVHGCYRKSRVATGAIATMLTTHRVMRTWTQMVDVYIALTEFAKAKFIQGGLPAEKIVVKPNFVGSDPGLGSGSGGYAIFVGRLSPEKGVDTLLKAWEKLNGKIPLKIVGDGPLAPQVASAVTQIPGIEWLGRKTSKEVYALVGDAAFLVLPSKWYEGLPHTILESFAVGTPVIASNLGSMSSLIDHNRTGRHFQADDSEDLANQVEWALAHPEQISRMRQEVRAEFEAKYTSKQSYSQIMEIYDAATRSAISAGALSAIAVAR